jgi:hypothetical protein
MKIKLQLIKNCIFFFILFFALFIIHKPLPGSAAATTSECGPAVDMGGDNVLVGKCKTATESCVTDRSEYNNECGTGKKCCEITALKNFTYDKAGTEGFGPFTFTGPIVPCGRAGQSDCTLCHLLILVSNVFLFAQSMLFLVAILLITVAGVLYIVSASSPGLKGMAKNMLTKTLTGFGIFLVAHLMVITLLKFISVNSSVLGNGSSWYTFTCDTASNFYNGTTNTDNQCCILSDDKNDPNYGKSANCVAPQSSGDKTECEEKCEETGGDADTVAKCKAACIDTKTCAQGTLTQNCYNNPACGGTMSVGCGKIIEAAKQLDAKNCEYNQPKRNGCVGNPGYTDCSDFVDTTYKSAGCSSPGNNSDTIGSKGETITDRNSLMAGDVLWKSGHVVICIDKGCSQVIHASGKKDDIKISGGSYVQEFSKVVRASKYCNSCTN